MLCNRKRIAKSRVASDLHNLDAVLNLLSFWGDDSHGCDLPWSADGHGCGIR